MPYGTAATDTRTPSLTESVEGLNRMIRDGRGLEAMELYYADNVAMQENENPPTVGKAANLARETEFFSKITDFRGVEIGRVAVGDGVTMVEQKWDYTHAEWGVRAYRQVAIQTWKDGRIVREQFFYGS